MGKKQKYYVVWKGVSPGIYTSWTDCQLQTKGYDGALYKSFDTLEEAEHAFASPAHHYIGNHKSDITHHPSKALPKDFDMNCVAVDAACSGNPGPMEYRGVYLLTGQEIFHFGPVHGTKQKGICMTIYSDSRNALAWVKQKKCKTKLERTAKTEELFQMIERAENWLKTHTYADIPILKWETEQWGEVPADFGRK